MLNLDLHSDLDLHLDLGWIWGGSGMDLGWIWVDQDGSSRPGSGPVRDTVLARFGIDSGPVRDPILARFGIRLLARFRLDSGPTQS